MNDLNEEIKDHWSQRRKRGYNWPKLIVMIAILIALIYGMKVLQNTGSTSSQPSAQVQDTTMVESPEQAP